MSFTRDELVTEIRAMADAENDTRWTAATVLRHLDVVFDREWSRILAVDPYYNITSAVVTPGAGGVVAGASITDGTGDSLKRRFKVIGITDGNARYVPSDFGENLMTPDIGPYGASLYRYWWKGADLVLYPSPTSATVTFSYRPQLPRALTSGSVAVTFPEPYEMLLAYGVAAEMLAKGGSETGASAEIKALADGVRDDLLADLSRRQTTPATWAYSDGVAEWGG